MLRIHSFLLGIKQKIKKVTGNSYKSCVMITAYSMVAIIIILCSESYYDNGNRILEAYAKTDDESNTFVKTEETATKAQIRTEDYIQSTQLEKAEINKDTIINEEDTFGWEMLVTVNVLSDIDQYGVKAASTDTTILEQKEQAIIEQEEIERQKEIKVEQERIAKEKAIEEKKALAKKKAEEIKKAKAKKEATHKQKKQVVKVSISSSDRKVLERIVEAEATGEDIKGKMLVASVILNRVKSNQFPNTVEKVVFQRNGSTVQFSPTKDGRYWSVTVTKETKEAVDRVLAGEDYSQGALFFSARSKADKNSMSWFDRNLKRLFKYGGHEFYTTK